MSYSTLFFDLDDTLYPNTTGLWPAIRDRMSEYMHVRLGLSRDEIPALRRSLYEKYGTTLRGLQIHYHVDADDYLAFVHDLPLEDYIHADPEIRLLLHSLPQRKLVFTNADADHARRVLAVLNLSDCFAGIIDLRALQFACKPEADAFKRALLLAGETEPQRCVLFDDSPNNLEGARVAGFCTVLVGASGNHPGVDYVIEGLKDLPQVMPELWSRAIKTGMA